MSAENERSAMRSAMRSAIDKLLNIAREYKRNARENTSARDRGLPTTKSNAERI